MRIRFIATSALAIASVALVSLQAASPRPQDASQKPSPPASAKCALPDGGTITVAYSSPRMRGRTVYGDLVPWGKVWRAGANEATTFVPSEDVQVGYLIVPARKEGYTLNVVPAQAKWMLIVSNLTGNWGIPYKGDATDFGRTEMKVSSLSAPLENFTIGLDQSPGGCTLHMDWETTSASVGIVPKK